MTLALNDIAMSGTTIAMLRTTFGALTTYLLFAVFGCFFAFSIFRLRQEFGRALHSDALVLVMTNIAMLWMLIPAALMPKMGSAMAVPGSAQRSMPAASPSSMSMADGNVWWSQTISWALIICLALSALWCLIKFPRCRGSERLRLCCNALMSVCMACAVGSGF